MKKRILVVDDEEHIVDLLRMNLRQNGYESIAAYDGAQAFTKAKSELPDCILLDLMLPVMNGLETCRRLKSDPMTKNIPVIMLTAKSEESDKVIGLGLGADDYITKPFGLRELFARIEVVLRRYNDVIVSSKQDMITFRDYTIDVKGHTFRKGKEKIDLTPNEFTILSKLASNLNRVVTREELLDVLEMGKESNDSRALDVHIRNLRKKINCSDGFEKVVETIRGVGYIVHD